MPGLVKAAPSIEDVIGEASRSQPDADFAPLCRAHELALRAHDGQFRKTGDPFVTHPLSVAHILAEIDSDVPTLEAAVLHDVVEDCEATLGMTREEILNLIGADFGETVKSLVDGVTKLRKLSFRSRVENQAQNFRKLLLAMAQDIRVVIIKLADRLHNMRTLDVFPPDKRRAVAEETQRIYAPLAHRLGIRRLQWELEDLSLEVIDEEAYREIQAKVARTRREREEYANRAVAALQSRLGAVGIPAEVHGRPKHFYSIYRKMMREEIDFEQIFDLIALRVMVSTVPECYASLGIVHELWVPLPGMLTDFIAKPKANGYQSLHTKVIGPEGTPLEVQIRTFDMHRVGEYGVAAHWRYKEDAGPTTDFDRKLSWLRQLLEMQSDTPGDGQFMHSLEEDLFQEQVFIFTPKGDLIELARGATPVDFAYRIHTAVGHECVGARVNGKPVSLTYELRNGDICEVVRKRGSQPSGDWLRFVQTTHARAKIRGFFREQNFAENVRAGRALLEREVSREGEDGMAMLTEERLDQVARSLNYQATDTMLAHIGARDLAASTVIVRLRMLVTEERLRSLGDLTILRRKARTREGKPEVVAAGIDGVEFQFGRCCEPLPGDPIVGYITRGRGLTVHRANCHNIRHLAGRDGSRLIACDWLVPEGTTQPVRLEVVVVDRVGMLRDATDVISHVGANITDISIASRQARRAVMHITVEVAGSAQIAALVSRLEALQDVISVRRIPR